MSALWWKMLSSGECFKNATALLQTLEAASLQWDHGWNSNKASSPHDLCCSDSGSKMASFSNKAAPVHQLFRPHVCTMSRTTSFICTFSHTCTKPHNIYKFALIRIMILFESTAFCWKHIQLACNICWATFTKNPPNASFTNREK